MSGQNITGHDEEPYLEVAFVVRLTFISTILLCFVFGCIFASLEYREIFIHSFVRNFQNDAELQDLSDPLPLWVRDALTSRWLR